MLLSAIRLLRLSLLSCVPLICWDGLCVWASAHQMHWAAEQQFCRAPRQQFGPSCMSTQCAVFHFTFTVKSWLLFPPLVLQTEGSSNPNLLLFRLPNPRCHFWFTSECNLWLTVCFYFRMWFICGTNINSLRCANISFLACFKAVFIFCSSLTKFRHHLKYRSTFSFLSCLAGSAKFP